VADRPRVIVALPHNGEASAVADWLRADGLEPVIRSSPRAAVDEMRDRAFELLICDATYAFRGGLHIESRSRSPRAVTIVVGEPGSASADGSVNSQVMVISRPIDSATLACFVSMALMDGRPARRSVRKPVNRFEAMVNGVPSHLVDVSVEGLRLEVARDRRAVLGPYFNVRVPLVGVSVTVQRMWTHSASSRHSSLWYGGALAGNRANIAMAWRTFVDTVPTAGGSADAAFVPSER
jgi:hypothetical protein